MTRGRALSVKVTQFWSGMCVTKEEFGGDAKSVESVSKIPGRSNVFGQMEVLGVWNVKSVEIL